MDESPTQPDHMEDEDRLWRESFEAAADDPDSVDIGYARVAQAEVMLPESRDIGGGCMSNNYGEIVTGRFPIQQLTGGQETCTVFIKPRTDGRKVVDIGISKPNGDKARSRTYFQRDELDNLINALVEARAVLDK